jgi:hypothetical protein
MSRRQESISRQRPSIERVRAYVTHTPVNTPLEAQVLSRKDAWDILSYIRSSSRNGVTAGELAKALAIPLGDVYSVLRKLADTELIFKTPRGMRPWNERSRRYAFEKLSWKRYGLDKTLTRVLEEDKVLSGLVQRLGNQFLESMTRIHDQMHGTDLTSILPRSGESNFCVECGTSHEAIDFFSALIIAIGKTFIESDEFKTLLFNLGYSRDTLSPAHP